MVSQNSNNKNSINYMDNESSELKGRFTGYLLCCIVLAVIGGAIQVGWAIGLYNTPETVIKNFYNKTYYERNNKFMSKSTYDLLWSITNSLLPLGAALGGISSSFVADYLGRKNGIILTNVFVIIAAIYNIISKFIKSYETLMIARFFSGIFCGLFTGIIPLYLSEIPPLNLRGLCGTLNQLSLVFGILLTNVYGLSEVLGTDKLWPLLVGLMLIPVIAHVILYFFGIESPKHLFINKGMLEEARKNLIKLRGNSNINLVENELKSLSLEKENLSKQKNVSWIELITVRSLRRPLLVAIGIMIAQQFSGINAVIFYSTKIFESVGLDGNWPTYGTIILGVVQLLMTVLCMFIIDKAGRKILLLAGFVGMCLFSFGLALARIFGNSDRKWLNYITIVCAVLYLVFFSIGPGAIPWLITSELFNSDVRAKANSIAVFTNWFCAFIVTITFPLIEAKIKDYSFLIFGGLLILFSLFILFFVPETKNRKTEDIISDFDQRFIFFFNQNNSNEKLDDEHQDTRDFRKNQIEMVNAVYQSDEEDDSFYEEYRF